MSFCEVMIGDCRTSLRELADTGLKVQTCVTSPPYFGLRDYGHDGQLGLEQNPDEYIAALVEVFRCVRDVLADDGTLWLNIGDTYATNGGAHGGRSDNQRGVGAKRTHDNGGGYQQARSAPEGLKAKDLIGIPWMLAFALRADGWYLRQDIIWHKPNPMPESVRDRCTKAHEYIFLLSKSDRYFFDSEAMKEPAAQPDRVRSDRFGGKKYDGATTMHSDGSVFTGSATRNRRSVWTVATRPYKGAHFATFPPSLIEPCILAGSRPGDIVLDPFGGSGTTGQVSLQHGRAAILCELNPAYEPLINERLAGAAA
jgi:DNA modification methylase